MNTNNMISITCCSTTTS